MQSTVVLTSTTNAVEVQEQPEQLVLRLRAPVERPRVTWGAGVIDNEHMGRLKSNCCCIYTPPRRWDDPSTWEPEEHETEHCRGHTLPEKKKPKKEDDDDDKENKRVPKEEETNGCGCDHC
uniref:Protein phosphatase 1 regulatory subunit 11 n=1 Tax=Caenorhabditis tropicalis TaxID=1561998 RepID=A0A1I7UCI0_9PELO